MVTPQPSYRRVCLLLPLGLSLLGAHGELSPESLHGVHGLDSVLVGVPDELALLEGDGGKVGGDTPLLQKSGSGALALLVGDDTLLGDGGGAGGELVDGGGQLLGLLHLLLGAAGLGGGVLGQDRDTAGDALGLLGDGGLDGLDELEVLLQAHVLGQGEDVVGLRLGVEGSLDEGLGLGGQHGQAGHVTDDDGGAGGGLLDGLGGLGDDLSRSSGGGGLDGSIGGGNLLRGGGAVLVTPS